MESRFNRVSGGPNKTAWGSLPRLNKFHKLRSGTGFTAAALEKCGAKHESCNIGGVVVDGDRMFVTTPAYMFAPSLKELAADAEKLVAEVLRLAMRPVRL